MILKQGSELMGCDESRSVKIAGLECVCKVKGGHSLAERFGGSFYVEMGIQDVSEVGSCLWVEVLVSSVVWFVDVVRGARVEHVGVVGVFGDEKGTEFTVSKVSVSVNIISLEYKLNILNLWKQPHSCQSISKLLKTAPSSSTEIKHSEAIHQIKVRLQGKLRLDRFKISFHLHQILKHMDQRPLLPIPQR